MFNINCDYNSVNAKFKKNNVQVLRHITSLQKQALQLGKSYKCLCSEIVAKFVFCNGEVYSLMYKKFILQSLRINAYEG